MEPPCYKGHSPCRPMHAAAHAGDPAYALRRGAISSGPFHRRPTPSVAALDTTRTDSAARCLAPAGSSPEREVQWLVPDAATAGHLRGCPNPTPSHKPVAGKPLVLPHLFPGKGRRQSRPIPESRTALHAKNHIASPSFFLGCFV
jgi:hypothetical protein